MFACVRLQIQGEGLVNKDLPSCWECPKCVQGITDPEVCAHQDMHTAFTIDSALLFACESSHGLGFCFLLN